MHGKENYRQNFGREYEYHRKDPIKKQRSRSESNTVDYEEYYLLGSNALQPGSSLTFQTNILPPSSGKNCKASMKPATSMRQAELCLNDFPFVRAILFLDCRNVCKNYIYIIHK
jgi:hypothetical protein